MDQHAPRGVTIDAPVLTIDSFEAREISPGVWEFYGSVTADDPGAVMIYFVGV